MTFSKLDMVDSVDQSNGRRHLEFRGMEEHQKSEHFQIDMKTQFQQLLSSRAQNPKKFGPPHLTHSQRRSAFIAAKHIIYRMGSARINFGSWFLSQVSRVGFCTLGSLLVCFNSMALRTYEPIDAAHLSVKGTRLQTFQFISTICTVFRAPENGSLPCG